jgi:hypothetical protein
MPQINLADANFEAVLVSLVSIVACSVMFPQRQQRIRLSRWHLR